MGNPYLFAIAGLFVAAIAIVVAPWVVFGLRGGTRRRRGWIVTALAAGLAGLVYLIWVWEVGLGIVAHILVVGAFVAFGLALSVAVYRRHRSKTALTLGGLFTVAIFVLHAVDFNPCKPYRRFFDSVQTGMTPAEVRTILDREFPTGGRFRVPHTGTTAEGLVFTLDLSDGRYNAENIYFALRDGRVVSKEYSGD